MAESDEEGIVTPAPQEVEDHVTIPLLSWIPSWDVPDTAETGAPLDYNRDRAPAVSICVAQPRGGV